MRHPCRVLIVNSLGLAHRLTADKRCGRLRFTLAVLGLRQRREVRKRLCAALCSTHFFLRSITSAEKNVAYRHRCTQYRAKANSSSNKKAAI